MHLEEKELRLRDAKAGPRAVPLSPPAVKVSRTCRASGNPWVIAGCKPGVRLPNFNAYWYRARARAGLDDVRLHDLRHSFASRALALGESLPMIGKLLGHSQIQTTARYAHLARDSIPGIGRQSSRQHRRGHIVRGLVRSTNAGNGLAGAQR